MLVSCPVCGGRFSLEAAMNDADGRKAVETALGIPLPEGKAGTVFHYLGLFRVPGSPRGMSWKKAYRLMTEIAGLIRSGHAQPKGRVARPTTPEMWVAGMSRMIDRASQLTLPMEDHGYLCRVVWDMADAEDRRRETERNRAERDGSLRAAITADREPEGPRLSLDEMREIRLQNKRKKRND